MRTISYILFAGTILLLAFTAHRSWAEYSIRINYASGKIPSELIEKEFLPLQKYFAVYFIDFDTCGDFASSVFDLSQIINEVLGEGNVFHKIILSSTNMELASRYAKLVDIDALVAIAGKEREYYIASAVPDKSESIVSEVVVGGIRSREVWWRSRLNLNEPALLRLEEVLRTHQQRR